MESGKGEIMSENGLESIESSTQKTHQWIADIAESASLEKREAYKALRAVLQTMRDRLPLDDAAHFGAQLPLFLRGIFYEGWQPSTIPLKMTRDEFLAAVREKIVTNQDIDPLQITQKVFAVMMSHVGKSEMAKIKHCFPKEMQALWADWAVVL
jgi:uncharacterized protein (DUF2267 family)